ncbi:hypothetical protein QNK01_09465 [Desemzia incerta]|uniref:hypothetical protein n=1 Tax=Desemzia incerta TaxID=82801 RepID=UPI0024C2E9EA|nr:hypothetical protein [Desemzia incerta]WHZ31697.1 hypothetical protein QNK01_09465 [Desemzia incerta]
MQPIVISISSVSGGGKSTVTKHLLQKLSLCKSLSFDQYKFEGPTDYLKWIKAGSNPNDWNLEPLIKDLENLLTQQLHYIVLDFPFSYQHHAISDFIDVAVFIDTPLDIALARRVKRDFSTSSIEAVNAEIDTYISAGRAGYLHMLENIKPSSDLIVDGTIPITETIKVIVQFIKELEDK